MSWRPWLLLPALWFSGTAAAETISLPKGSGPKKAGLAAMESAIEKALVQGGHQVVRGKALAAAAKRSGSSAASAEAAKEAGAAYWIALKATKAGKRFTVKAEVLAVADGSEIFAASETYRGSKDAKKIGASLGRGIAKVIPEAAAPPPPEEPERAVVAAAEEEPEPAAPAAPTIAAPVAPSAPLPKDEAPVAAAPAAGGREAPLLTLALGGGSQALSAYAVTVAGNSTALAYSLTPLWLLAANLRFDIPTTGLGIEADLAFAPVRYALAVEPAVTPNDPSGQFIDFGASIVYRLPLSGYENAVRDGFALEPLIGFRYATVAVDEQQPSSVVVSASAVTPQLGLRALVGIGDEIELYADARFRLVLGYSESPTTTGDSGGGIGLRFGGGGRYWLSPAFGVGLDLGYAFDSVSLTGRGTRIRFEADPQLDDASVLASSLRVAFNVVLAL